MKLRTFCFFSICFLALWLWIFSPYSPPKSLPKESRISAIGAMSQGIQQEGFANAETLREFHFPADRGPHLDYQTEWWYYTGNLKGEKRRFGFQLTIFRRALQPKKQERSSAWGTNEIYFAHFSLSDIQNQVFYHSERFSRKGNGLAGAQSSPFRVWIDDWSIEGPENKVTLKAQGENYAIDLQVSPLKPIVFQGNKGLSQKSAEKGNASYYYAQTRLKTTGTVEINSKPIKVEGLSWLDREWSTSALGKKQSGWDWFALQLENGCEIMLYQLRLSGGGIDPYSSGSFINAKGEKKHLKVDDFEISVLDTWTSLETGITYPSGWEIKIREPNIALEVTPLQKKQEWPDTFRYWEGAVKVEGEKNKGYGYVELTGYEKH